METETAPVSMRLSHNEHMKEYAPILNAKEEAMINEAIIGIADDDVDMDALLASIDVEVDFPEVN